MDIVKDPWPINQCCIFCPLNNNNNNNSTTMQLFLVDLIIQPVVRVDQL